MRRLGLTAAAALFAAAAAWPQWSFTLDTTFRTQIVDKNVNALHLLPDGGIFLSGRIRFPGDISDRGSAKLLPDGTRDMGFPAFPQTTGGGKIVPWGAAFYVLPAATVRRMTPDGLIDPTFVSTNASPYFLSGSGGDFHVFPDGRVLLSGTHMLSDSIRGFVGSYELIWITNTGYLDTTRVHRNANGPIWAFKELPDGKFICSCSCTQYEGQPVSRLFRVHADGALDTTFQSTITMGRIYAIEPLLDGRLLLGGNFRFSGSLQDTVRLARLLPDGTRDLSFASLAFAGNGNWWPPSGTIVFDIFPFHAGNHIIAGQFVSVAGQERKGLCMVDSSGSLLPVFDGCGAGPFTYQTSTNATPLNVYWNQDSTALYICGAYTGYDDGTTNDPQQRFVSRLLVSELTTGVASLSPEEEPGVRVYPNPARGTVMFTYDDPLLSGQQGRIVVRDLSGRVVATLAINGTSGRHTWDAQGVAPGTYVVQYLAGNTVLHTERLMIQR
jgi:hypothetical protein